MLKVLGISGLGLIVLLILVLPLNVAHAQEAKFPVIVLYKEKITKVHTDEIKKRHGEVKKSWKVINGLTTDLSAIDIEELKKDPSVLAVEQDLPVYSMDLTADLQIRADQVWASGNIVGQGVPVAILDTGIDNTHPEFTGRITLCHSEITNSNTCQDQNGHGTHVAGIIGATGINSNAKGVAPGVQYYVDQVLDSTGSGSFSGVISGIDWAVANHAKVISMSLGSIPLATIEPNCDSQFLSLTTAINNAVNAGVTVVAAAGNSGIQGVGAPGCMSNVIAVTAVDSNDVVASWSSKGGPVQDHGIAAPGVNIFSTYIPQTYTTLSGTSMATPAVSGTVALLLQANPSLTPTQVKSTLFSTACTTQTSPSCQTGSVPNTSYGYGRVDTLAAYNKIRGQPSSTIDITSTSNSSPRWTVDSVYVSGSVTGSVLGDSVTINWGDGTISAGNAITGNLWGPVIHSYASSAIGTNPNDIIATLRDNTNGIKATSVSSTVIVQKHKTSLSLVSTPKVPWSRPVAFAATLIDVDTGGVPISFKTIHFNGTGIIGVSDLPTNSSGKVTSVGTSPNTVASDWTYQGHFAGDPLYFNSDSKINTYNTIKHSTTLNLAMTPNLIAVDGQYSVSGYLKDGTNGTTLNSQTISFTSSPSIIINSAVTNVAGKYLVTSLVAPNTPGSYTIQSNYGGSPLYSISHSPIKSMTVFTPVVFQMNDNITSQGLGTYSGRPILAEYISGTSSLVGKSIDTITVQLKRSGLPSGPAQIGILNNDLSVKQLFGTINSSNISTSYTPYSFSLSVPQIYKIQSGDRIGIKFTGGNSTNFVAIMTDTTNSFDGTNSYLTYYATLWQTFTGKDLTMILKLHS